MRRGEETRIAVSDDLVTRGVGHRDLALEYRDKRIALVACLEQLPRDPSRGQRG